MTTSPIAWQQSAACRHADPDLFFPVAAVRRALTQTTRAKHICAGCPVRGTCLEYALEAGVSDGIWGGLTPQERHRERRRRQAAGRRSREVPATGTAAS